MQQTLDMTQTAWLAFRNYYKKIVNKYEKETMLETHGQRLLYIDGAPVHAAKSINIFSAKNLFNFVQSF